jgi:hypothetical protein
MSEIIFDVTIDETGRYIAAARTSGIATDADSWEELETNAVYLTKTRFAIDQRPTHVRLLLDHETVLHTR